MRVFVTGASGYIGHAVAKAFRYNGHFVKGLVRSEENASRLRKEEIEPVIGDLQDLKRWREVLDEADVYVQCALEQSADGIKKDEAAIDLLIQAASNASSPKTILYTSGVWVYGNTKNRVVDESSPVSPIDKIRWRPLHEEKLLQAAKKTLRPIVIRPGCVYGGKGGLTALWFAAAKKGNLEIVGKGDNRWAMVHLHDLARLYVKAAEKELNGVILNGTDHSRNTVREMAEAVLGLGMTKTMTHLSDDQAQKQFGPLIEGLKIDQQVSNGRAARLLDWHPRHSSFIQEVHLCYEAWNSEL